MSLTSCLGHWIDSDSATSCECEFFFASRRRHTSLQGDWSSDVCSSDLADVVADNWSGALAPARTPPAVIAKLNAALNTAVRNPETRAKLADNGVSATGGSPEDLVALIAAETARWRKVVKEIGVKVQAE